MFLLSFLIANAFAAFEPNPTPFPVFLKEGFSSILEFEETPSQVVLGDQNLFQVEKLKSSIVLKPLVPFATTNMFVYFRSKQTRLFILTAAEDVEPTYYRKFSNTIPELTVPAINEAVPTDKTQKALGNPASLVKHKSTSKKKREVIITAAKFDQKKDFLTLDLTVSADSNQKLSPAWDLVRLRNKEKVIGPSKLWSERREVQKDSSIKVRLIFMRPNLSTDLKDTRLIVPIKGSTQTLAAELKRSEM